MNQKEYDLIGRIFSEERPTLDDTGNEDYDKGRTAEWNKLVFLLAGSFQICYPKTFDRDKFLAACGIQPGRE